jgi:hypothetical protein
MHPNGVCLPATAQALAESSTPDGAPVPQVYNLTTYPHLVGFLDALGVDTEPSEMSFALSIDEGRLEWGSHDLDTVFAQRSNAASPSFLRMVADVVRFGQQAPKASSSWGALHGAARRWWCCMALHGAAWHWRRWWPRWLQLSHLLLGSSSGGAAHQHHGAAQDLQPWPWLWVSRHLHRQPADARPPPPPSRCTPAGADGP